MSTLAASQAISPLARHVPLKGATGGLDCSENAEEIPKSLKHSSDFTRWRPSLHLLAPHGWLNDPCGPGYDPTTETYHLAFQWNPNGNDWGDIAWGHSISRDLVVWETSPQPCLVPSAHYDFRGVFTGCFQATDVNGERNGTLTYIYTSVNQLPIHYSIPYTSGSESLSIAISRDQGQTWNRLPSNPILPGPPAGLSVTGWRDPFISASPSALAEARHDNVRSGFISGGLVDRTPTVFVYSLKKDNLAEWRYLGPLLDVGLNFCPSRWSGDFGVNWEVPNYVTLKDDEGTLRDFIIMGAEGCLPRHEKNQTTLARDSRIQRSQLWIGLKSRDNPKPTRSSSALMDYSFGGIFDNGLFYAANSFWDPVVNQHVIFGWITEEDLPDDIRHLQGWSGLISLPRVLKLITIHGVKKARSTRHLEEITSLELTPDDNGTYTVRTLGIIPDPRLQRLREKARRTDISRVPLPGLNEGGEDIRFRKPFVPLYTQCWEAEATIIVSKSARRAGFIIYHTSGTLYMFRPYLCDLFFFYFFFFWLAFPRVRKRSNPASLFHITDLHIKTLVYWDSTSETFIIERPHIQAPISHAPEAAPFTLFTLIGSSDSASENRHGYSAAETEESLNIRAFFDTSVLEIFVNERLELSTRVYLPDKREWEHGGIYFFAENKRDPETPNYPVESGRLGNGDISMLVSCRIWDRLQK